MDLKTFVRANADRVIAVALVVVGVLALVAGWFGISGTGLAAEQIPYLISGGIGGVVLVVIGAAVWVSADLQDEWRRLDAIEERLEALTPTRTTQRDDPPASSANGWSASSQRKKVSGEAPT